jgi:hypothetical protein
MAHVPRVTEPVGFLSEHTVEYAVVASATRALSPLGCRITPLFFWASREGSRFGRAGGPDGPTRVLAMYPRRPKVLHPGQDWVRTKFNNVLFHHSHALAAGGICVVAGVPCISSLADFGVDSQIAWFLLKPDALPEDRYIDISIVSEPRCLRRSSEDGVIGPLLETTLVSIVKEHCTTNSWHHHLETIRQAGKRQSDHPWVPYWSGWQAFYKPIYLLLH